MFVVGARCGAFGMGLPQRWQAGGSLVVEDAPQQWRRFVFAAGAVRAAIVAAGAGAPAQPLGMGAFVNRVEDAQALGTSGVDE